MYTGRVYPNYLSGTAYLMSIDVVSKLYSAALRTPIFHLEDVYITGNKCSIIINTVLKHNYTEKITLKESKFQFDILMHVYVFHKTFLENSKD